MNRLFLILIFVSLTLTSCGAGKPKGGEGISYFGAAWLNNERIIYTKQVETVRFSYNPIAALGNNTSQLVRIDYFICTMDLNGEDEKILKQFSVTDPKGGKGVRRIFMVEKGKEIPLSTERPQRPSVYSCSNNLIVFVARISEGGAGSPGPIYVMEPDGSQLRKIIEKGDYPRVSPDGKMILYTVWQDRIPRLWLINTDGTGKRMLVERGSHGVWSPDGKRIAYWKDKDYLVIIDSDGKNPVEVTRSNYPLDWTPDGSMILRDGRFYNIVTKKSVLDLPKLAAIPNDPSLSPDGEKIVGSNAGLDADICVVYMNITEREKAVKVLKKTHFKKWDH